MESVSSQGGESTLSYILGMARSFLKFKVIKISSKITLALKMITCINYF